MKDSFRLLSMLVGLLCCSVMSAADFSYSITQHSERFEQLLDIDADISVLAEGFTWSEGPVWIPDAEGPYLLFSDVPQNTIYRWDEALGIRIFLQPSGFDGEDASAYREPGTNGLIRLDTDTIIAANHGQRELTLISLRDKTKATLIAQYQGRSLNTPNDLVRAANGDIFFTDPPYGLEGINDSPLKEQAFNGVYRLSSNGDISLIDGQLSYPNGIGLLPDQHTLIVSVSDPQNPVWLRYTLNLMGDVISMREFNNARADLAEGLPGLPDGLVVDNQGNVFASGPGGIFIFAADGELLGKINLDRAAANCTFGGDGSVLYITAGDLLLRVQTRTSGI